MLHPGSAKSGDVAEAIKRAGQGDRARRWPRPRAARCILEDTAGAGGTLGRSFEELAALIEAAGGGQRLGMCLDSCHLLASGYDIRTRRGPRPRPSTSATGVSALERLASLHLNDSA